jgi:hypothetical protein
MEFADELAAFEAEVAGLSDAGGVGAGSAAAGSAVAGGTAGRGAATGGAAAGGPAAGGPAAVGAAVTPTVQPHPAGASSKRTREDDTVVAESAVSAAPTLSAQYVAALGRAAEMLAPAGTKRSRTSLGAAPTRPTLAEEEAAQQQQQQQQKQQASDPQQQQEGAIGPSLGPLGGEGGGKQKRHLRTAAGKTWEDPSLADWPDDDFRIWVGQLGPECKDALLEQVFSKYPSFNMARAAIDKRSGECRGFGFVSFADPMEMVRAMRENEGKYCGTRRMRIKRSDDKKRDVNWVRKQEKKEEKLVARFQK